MDDDIKSEVLERLELDVKFGFENKYELFENLIDMFYDVEDFDETWLKDEIESKIAEHINQSRNWERPTDFEKLRDAFDELNANGIVGLHKAGYTRQDGEDDCMEIIEELSSLGINAKGYCYYHTQDLERLIEGDNLLYLGFDSHNGEDESAVHVAEEIVEVLRQSEFNVKWNGSLNNRIEVSGIEWKKIIDGEDYNYDRVFRIVKKYFGTDKPSNKKKDSKPFWKFW
ncbi:DUF6891 domain-containing protein [Winogradskyella tangerina]|uniref:DUF6891 domain-containing protein n=1 Tax=Winogradskyella tangerina TaxID=2023240 RepID=UPI000DBE54DE|nr:hypothetical protein [Winogradskyella tangerina]